ncbi:hypothetical protein EJ02DRAFT_177275 [Clathrospora elynae]|uniref:Uncharacterized protein n=1 Tax=Clathrospora elynae TaxID=706981 RepID=A0A6A5SRQ1_9PLEO|nr:hypothetical protein EJ02DRAFT_177275 [Clathrospora elynae]
MSTYQAHGVSARHPRAPSPNRGPQFVDCGLDTRTRLNLHQFLELGWHPEAIAARKSCSCHVVDNVAANLRKHGSVCQPVSRLGALARISPADGKALFKHLVRSGWLYQDEIV